MSKRPESRDDSVPPDPSRGDLESKPRRPQPPLDSDVRPQNSPSKVKVTPLDDARNVKDGIEVDET